MEAPGTDDAPLDSCERVISTGSLKTNFVVMSIGFSVNHATVVTVIALATAHLGTELGAYDLAVFNVVYVATGLAVQSMVVRRLGLKGALLAGTTLYFLYVVSFLFATLCEDGSRVQWVSALSGAIAGGFGAGFLWSAQGAYFTANAELYAAERGITTSEATAMFSGIFASWYLATEVITKVLASLLMGSTWGAEGMEHAVYAVFAAMAALSAVVLCSIQDLGAQSTQKPEVSSYLSSPLSSLEDSESADLRSDNPIAAPVAGEGGPVPAPVIVGASFEDEHEGSAENCSSVQLMRRDPKCLLMAPMQMSFGFVAAMLNGWVNGVAVERGTGCDGWCPQIGRHNIGYLIALSTGVAALSSTIFSWYSTYTAKQGQECRARCFVGKPGPMLVGSCAYVFFGLLLLGDLHSPEELGQWSHLLPLYIAQGVGRGNFESTNKAVFADFFPGSKAEPAFANFVIWTGLSMSIGYLAIPHVHLAALSVLCAVTAVGGGTCYMIAHRMHQTDTAVQKSDTREDLMKNSGHPLTTNDL